MAGKDAENAHEETPLDPFSAGKTTVWTTDRIVIVVLNCIYCFLWSLYYTVTVPILPTYAEQYGFNAVGQAAILAAQQIGWFIGLPFVNMASLRPLTMVYVGAMSYVFASAIVVWHQSLWTLITGRILEGFGSSLLSVLLTSVIAREIPQECKGFVFGLRSSISSIGMFFGPVVGGVLYPHGGLRLPMIVLTVMALCSLLAFVLFTKDSWFRSYEERVASFRASNTSMMERLGELLQDRELPWLLTTHFLGWSFTGLMFMAVPHYMVNELNLSSATASSFWLVCEMVKVCSVFIGGLICDWFKPWYVLYTTVACHHIFQLTLGVQTLISPTSSWSFLIACCLVFASAVNSMPAPAFLKIMTSSVRKRHEEILSVMDFTTATALLLGPFYASFLYDSLGFAFLVITFALLSFSVDLLSAYATRELRVSPDSKLEASSWTREFSG